MTKSRTRLYELSAAAYANSDYTGRSETLYAEAQGNSDAIPWADRGVTTPARRFRIVYERSN